MKEWNYDNEQWTRLPYHLKHLPLFTRHHDLFSMVIRFIWAILMKGLVFRFYIRLKLVGPSFREIHKTHPKLIIISNHSSHLDATSIAAAIPFRYWLDLYIAAAKDYFFSNWLFTFFSQHCLGAIPIDRKDKKGEAISLCINLLTNLSNIWFIMFPEGTRSQDGKLKDFKKGISVFSQRSQVPILFLYIDGASRLWPKGLFFTKPGKLTIHIGPVHPPAPIADINQAYQAFVARINPEAIEKNPYISHH